MDFKSLISKIESIDGKIDTPKAPELPKSVQLNEDAQLRVLSGRSTYVAEAKKKAEEDVKEADDMKVGDKKNISTGTVEKTKTGIIHKSQASTTSTLAIGQRHIIDTSYAHTSPISVSLAIGDFAGETLVRCCVQVEAISAFLEVNAEVPHIERINALTFATD